MTPVLPCWLQNAAVLCRGDTNRDLALLTANCRDSFVCCAKVQRTPADCACGGKGWVLEHCAVDGVGKEGREINMDKKKKSR